MKRPMEISTNCRIVKIIKENFTKFPRLHGDEINEANAFLYKCIDEKVLNELGNFMDKEIPCWNTPDKYKDNTFFGGKRDDGVFVPWGIRLEENLESFAGGGNKSVMKHIIKNGNYTYHQPQIVVKITPNWLHKMFKWNHGHINNVQNWVELYQKTPFITPSGRGGHANKTCFALLNKVKQEPTIMYDVLNFGCIKNTSLIKDLYTKFENQLKCKLPNDDDPNWKKNQLQCWDDIVKIIREKFIQTLIRLHKEKLEIKVVPIGFTIQYYDKESEKNNNVFLKNNSRFHGRKSCNTDNTKLLLDVDEIMKKIVKDIQGL